MEIERLRTLDLESALIVGLLVDTASQTATLQVDIDADYHREWQAAELGGLSGPAVIDFEFRGVTSATLSYMQPAPAGTAPDEPPHVYEISRWSVRRKSGGLFKLDVRTHWGPRCAIVFANVEVRKSARAPGVRHDYDARRAKRYPREKARDLR